LHNNSNESKNLNNSKQIATNDPHKSLNTNNLLPSEINSASQWEIRLRFILLRSDFILF
jgi:hypothetical protein